MSVRQLFWAGLLAATLLMPSAALAQETSPEPAEQEGCQAGELCGSGDREDRFRNDDGAGAPDPPGNYTRSLTTLGLIAAVVGAYLFIALTGRSIFRRKPKKA
ncbi:MAG TPA: hypothetical protein VFV09_11675 [Actinomycetota bacterium]|jgi:hypothetical protein|nr:hypothetical protein [Actinomycetota bacterium]